MFIFEKDPFFFNMYMEFNLGIEFIIAYIGTKAEYDINIPHNKLNIFNNQDAFSISLTYRYAFKSKYKKYFNIRPQKN